VQEQSSPSSSNKVLIASIVGGVLGLLCIVGAIAIAFALGKRRGAASQSQSSTAVSLPTLSPQSSPSSTKTKTQTQGEYDTIVIQMQPHSTYESGQIENFR
jgi:hypothetical protein